MSLCLKLPKNHLVYFSLVPRLWCKESKKEVDRQRKLESGKNETLFTQLLSILSQSKESFIIFQHNSFFFYYRIERMEKGKCRY